MNMMDFCFQVFVSLSTNILMVPNFTLLKPKPPERSNSQELRFSTLAGPTVTILGSMDDIFRELNGSWVQLCPNDIQNSRRSFGNQLICAADLQKLRKNMRLRFVPTSPISQMKTLLRFPHVRHLTQSKVWWNTTQAMSTGKKTEDSMVDLILLYFFSLVSWKMESSEKNSFLIAECVQMTSNQ